MVHLRYKGINLKKPGDYLRNRENQAYRRLFEYVIKEKIVEKIILIADNDKDHDMFNDLNYIEKNLMVQKEGISLVQHAKFYICQHSGPVNLCNVLDVPVYITEGLPWWQGTYSKSDLILFKKPTKGKKNFKIKSII